MMLAAGTVIGGRYEIQEKIGTGGMAYVYRAKDIKLERNVTLKVLKEEFANDENFKSRFEIEARSAAKLSHPNIVNAYDFGEENGICYIVMEYIHGDTLKQIILNSAPLDEIVALSIASQMASALSHAHKNGVVHRDIKSQNILISVDGTVKITDFGIAKAAAVSTATTTTTAMGSVYYFSPEQARGGYVDEKSDIYSLGITMYEMITGKLPFEGNTPVAIALKHLNDQLPDIRELNPKVSDEFCAIIKKAAAKRKDDRYANADLLLEDLRRKLSEAATSYEEPEETVEEAAENIIEAADKEISKDEFAGAAVGAMGAAATASIVAETVESVEKEAAEEEEISEKQTSFIPYINEEEEEKEAEVKPDEEVKLEISSGKKGGYTRSNREYEIPERTVGFETYGKKLKLNKKGYDDYENTYVEPLRRRKNTETDYNDDDYDDYDDEYRSKEKKVVIAAVITALIIIAVITVFGAKFITGKSLVSNIFSSFNSESMPSITGMTLEEAQEKTERLGITIEVAGNVTSDYEVGLIVEQDIEAGTDIEEGTVVMVTVSAGTTVPTMPDVVYKTVDEAVEMIQEKTGIKAEVRYEFDEENPENVVIAQSPVADSEINPATTVIITVSKGSEGHMVLVPNFIMDNIEIAKKEATAVGLNVSSVTEKPSNSIEAGRIMEQSIGSGIEVEAGARIEFVVSSGPAEEGEGMTGDSTDTSGDNTPSSTGGTSTKTFTVDAPAEAIDESNISIKILKIVDGNVTVAYNGSASMDEFPLSVPVTAEGTAEIQLYVDNVYQWSDMVNFAEGGN